VCDGEALMLLCDRTDGVHVARTVHDLHEAAREAKEWLR
jgi:hypothetical protein